MMSNFFKKIYSEIVREVKKISIPQTLIIVFLATFFLGIAAYFYPDYITKYHRMIDTTAVEYYFDYYVRNGYFIIPYFLFVILLFAFIGQLLLIKVYKKSFPLGTQLNALLLLIGSAASLIIYFSMPYYLPDLSSINLAEYEPKDAIEEKDVILTKNDFCGTQIDFFFAPYEGFSIKAFGIVQELEKEISIPINYQCNVRDRNINEDIACEQNHGVTYKKEMNTLFEEWMTDKARPVLVLGCKYAYKGIYTTHVYKEVICEHLGEEC